MSVKKTFPVLLDLKRPMSNEPFEVVEGDNGNVLHIVLTDSGVAVDLTGCRVVSVFTVDGGTATQDSGTENGGVTIGGTNHNEIDIDLFITSFSADGLTECELQVYSGENQSTLVTTARFNFKSRRSILNDDTISATDKYPILTKLIEDVTALKRGAQADFAEDDATKPAYIKNVPASFTPSAHATTHGTGGSDAITPASIGAMPSGATPTPAAHASSHATGGEDAITPSAIGAAALNDDNKVNAAQASAAVVSISDSTTLVLGHAGKLLSVNSTNAVTVTVPANSDVAFPVGTEIEICQYGAGTVTIASASGVATCSMDSAVATAGQYASVCLKKLGTDEWLLGGALG